MSKALLKSAKRAIGEKHYAEAEELSKQLLDYEPNNYNGLVFLGLSQFNLGKVDRSAKHYKEASEIIPSNPLAWQGLQNLYKKTNDIKDLLDVTCRLVDIFLEANDFEKAANTLKDSVSHIEDVGPNEEVGYFNIIIS